MSLISNSWILVLLWIIVYSDPAFSCGGIVTGRKGEIKTPNFPGFYGTNLHCTWTIQVDENETITIEFLTFNVEKSILWGVSCPDTFSVYDGPDKDSTQLITPACGQRILGPLHSSGNVLTLTFDSDYGTGSNGVRLKWQVSDKFTLHTEAKTWKEANSVCMKDGGHLAVQTKLNKQLILNLLGERFVRLWIGEYYTPWIWLLGCYKDPGLNLTSSKRYVETKENEAKVCQYHCQHTVYFGMMDSKCYCLTAEDIDKLQFSKSWYECKFSCPGNNEERCGGAYGLNVFMNDICWSNSSTWVAKISKTISGKTCQAWSSDFPHEHAFHDDDIFPDGSETKASNYCRDPDGRGAPWCFTTDPNVLWQFCDAPPCPGTCWSEPTRYTGHLNVTVPGHKCRNWMDDPPSGQPAFHDGLLFPNSTVSEAANFCRSPDNDPLLWCYLDSKSNGPVWEYCGSPPCFDSTEVEGNGELCRLFWIKDNKFYFKEHDCDDSERFWCFVDEKSSNVSETFTKGGFSKATKARESCRRPSLYSLSNYKTLFGLIVTHSDKLRVKHWLGNFRGEDNTNKKDGVSTPSACKTIEKSYGGLRTSFQPNCQLSLDFICQKDAVLCGGKFYSNRGNISSPGYPDEYENNDYCEWEIHVSEERVIKIVFHDVDIEQTRSKTCPFDYIEVLENHINPPKSIGKICGESSNVSIISASNQVLITFKTDKKVSKRGFYLEWISDLIQTTTSTTDTTTTSTTDTTTTSTTDTTTTSTTDTTTTSTTDKQSSCTTKENEKKETDKLINETPDTDKAGLGGAPLAGIVVGAVLAILVVVVVVLVVFVLKRKKERKAGAQTILELKALESTKPANIPSNSETPQQDVYSNPVPKAYRQPQQLVSDDHVQLDSGDDTYYHHLHQTNINKATPGESRNPYGRLHTPDLYDHTTDSKVQETGDMYDHFDSDKTDSLDKDGKGTDAYSRGTPQKIQNPNVYDYTTAPVGQNRQDTYNVANADKTDWLHSKDEDSISTSNNGSNEIVTKGTHNDIENYLTPIGENLNNTMGQANTADIETKNASKNDDYDKEVDIEDDTYYNVSDDKTNEQTADSEQHLYEIEDAEQDYDNLNN